MQIKLHHSLQELSLQAWQSIEDPDFPFADYQFLLSLELSHCVGKTSGWLPHYITAWEDEILKGAVYLYEKSHSYGEYIFDWEWAAAYQNHGYAYYPKLLGAVPFTPASGPKFLIHPQANRNSVQETLVKAALDLCQTKQSSSLHFLFLRPEELPILEQHNFLVRHSYQFHWTNLGFKSFQDYEQALTRKRRQQVKKERNSIAKANLEIVLLQGEDIKTGHLKALWQFYQITHQQRGSPPYLTQDCFYLWREHLKENLVLILAREGSEWVAGSLNFLKGKVLYGRYWGASQNIPYLHFELCYYRNIELAIELGLERFEAGAQGTHKWLRGLVPELTYSAHWIADLQFRKAIKQFLDEEKNLLREQLELAKKHSPYK